MEAVTPAVEDEELWTRAVEVFGCPEKARQWLVQPNPALGGCSPAEAALSRRQDVLDVLGRIEHGVIS